MRERAREGEREGDGECDGEEEEEKSASQIRRKESRFTVESKAFEIVVEERRGKIQGRIGEEETRWGREWKEQGRVYSMTRGTNRAGGFIQLGVSDIEGKRFYIFVPRGRRDKRGWTTMVEKLNQVLGFFGKNPENQKGKVVEKVAMGRSYATMVGKSLSGNSNVVAVKVKKEESKGLIQKLKHCVVASWRDGSGGEDDMEKLGQVWAKSWDLKGNLGLAKLNKRKALLEFENLEEARRVISSGSCVLEGTQVRLEHWSPRSGCWAEGEERNEAWVRIVGLPISLWSPEILRRVGDACGGFITVDEHTKSMGDLQWARILVKLRWEARPSVLEIEGEEESYAVSLWWECWPVVRRKCRNEADRHSREVRGEEVSRAGAASEEGLGEWEARDAANRQTNYPPEAETFVARETEDTRKLQGVIRLTKTDRALEEESMRYGMGSGSWGKRALGDSHLNSFFLIGLWGGGGEFFDRSRDLDEEGRADNSMWLTVYEACNERIKECKELVVIKCSSDKGREMGGGETERLGTGQRAPNCDCPMKVKIFELEREGANDSSKRKVIKTFIRNQRVDLMCIQETKLHCMTDSIARSIGFGRFLGWKAVNAEGASGENGTVWVFTGVYGPFSKVERDALWEEFGAIRGLWEDPWFLVSPSWIDQFSGINQCRLPRPVSDHFPIIWWQGIDVRGSASYKLATKMKEIKQKLKVWNREVFGKLECNKSAALQQVEFWDREENDRILTMEETELKKEAKENGAHRRNNFMERIKINGEWFLEEQEIREGIANAFKELLSEDTGWKADIGSLQFDQISQEEAEILERPFTEEEIHGL
ncbi:hypothetical protein CK203_015983 [Vitis vinifera]|uniref:DUF4283 domain-containing protein n=1 Tax=Vitis vinifera TaxID=29760 RepID=A0A438JRF1_VITVI|nr:hypothetical protein CK203_015983 [Vitis vinifera]